MFYFIFFLHFSYETAFYITFLSEKPAVICEQSEVGEHLVSFYFIVFYIFLKSYLLNFQWHSPVTLLRMVKNMELFVLPPQFYEISQFVPHKSYEYLKNFAKERNGKGTVMFQPIVYICTDGSVSVLPGTSIIAYFYFHPYLCVTLNIIQVMITILAALDLPQNIVIWILAPVSFVNVLSAYIVLKILVHPMQQYI